MVSVQRWPVTLDGDCVIAVVISWWCLAFDTAQLWRGDVSFVARVSALLSMGSQSTLEWGKSRTLGAFLYWVKSMKSSAQKVTPQLPKKNPSPGMPLLGPSAKTGFLQRWLSRGQVPPSPLVIPRPVFSRLSACHRTVRVTLYMIFQNNTLFKYCIRNWM